MKKLIIAGVITLFFLTGYTPAFSADVAKIGVVNFDKILKESSAGKMTQQQLKTKGQELQGKLKKGKEELEELSKSFEREALVLSPEKKREKERDFRIRVNDLKKMQEDFAKELKRMEITLINQIQKDIFEIAGKIGKDEGYLMILERKTAGILYVPDQVDITDSVIQKYNAKTSKGQ
ncbi:OmpH family outer membrane protein [Desulfospira joergensenii]|uniref:OmpH family outer membrane protein n=1 Tax=Desulfospira joergensenii TaxID=53329 RepID=UPI0003B2FD32|nr:OmpH family outer membrane protein [Desulfospira joergensenii]